MRVRSRTATTAVTLALACGVGATAAPAAEAAQQPGNSAPQAQASGLLDGLGGLLGGLLGSGGSQPLEDLLGILRGGQTPTSGLLQPVTDLLDQLAATPGLPPTVAELLRDVTALLGGLPSGQPLDPALLAPIEALLRDLAGTAGLPAAASSLLNQLAGVLGGGSGGGDLLALPVNILRLVPATIDELDGLVSALIDSERPTGALLAPVARLFDEVAVSVPGPLGELLREVAAALLRGTSGEIDPLLIGQIRRLLTMIGNTPGVTVEQRSVIERVTTLLTQAAASNNAPKPAAILATKRDRAVIKRVNVDPSRNRVGLRVKCPQRAPSTCVVRVTARFAGRKAANPKSTRIGAGRSKVVRLRLLKKARSASIRRGGKLRIRVVTRFGTQSFSFDKLLKLRRLNRARS